MAGTATDTRRVSERRRQELIEAAFRQIAEGGFEGLRTREVAAEVGVNIATLHYYFPTKESLIRGVLDHAMNRFRTTLEPHGSPSEQLRNHLRAVRTLMVEEPELRTVMAELVLRSARDESIEKIVKEMFETWHTTVRGLLRRAVRDGGLHSELDSDGVASLIIATVLSQTLPVMSGTDHGDEALRQLEKWLGLTSRRRNQSTD